MILLHAHKGTCSKRNLEWDACLPTYLYLPTYPLRAYLPRHLGAYRRYIVKAGTDNPIEWAAGAAHPLTIVHYAAYPVLCTQALLSQRRFKSRQSPEAAGGGIVSTQVGR